ncbi:MAG: DsbA family protein [Flavisolibacter sp.]
MARLKTAVGKKDHRLGTDVAPITLVEYGDFQCPHCGLAHPLIKKLLHEMGEQILFVFRHFPLQEVHPHAFHAALASEAAGQQGKFWIMHDLIFENQNRLGTQMLLDLAENIPLDMREFAKDWQSRDSVEKVETDFESGVRSGVNGTPGFFVNGNHLFTYDETYESLADAVQLALEMKTPDTFF